ncbi:MAG TPA: putative lipid II flippase FtsW [Acidimicrobiales bacterium]|jgi:cell division protein FtsW|nr:putative lipid II flippase FtsW [Acidimicrobiales bacterium]
MADTTRGAALPPANGGDRSWAGLSAVVALLCGIGLMMVLSASSVSALRVYGGPWVLFERQLVWVVAGAVAMAVAARVDYRKWRRLAIPLTVVCMGLLVLVLVPSLGVTVSGSSRWIGIGQARFQPSEVMKLAMLLFTADLLARRTARWGSAAVVLQPVLLVTAAAALLILKQPDMGTAMIMVLVVLTVLFVGGVPLARMGLLTLAVSSAGLFFSLAEGYRRARMFSFMNPWKDPSNTGYQMAQSLVALGTGHLTGVGLGASRAKWGFLPNAHTDFIFAIIGEELGLVGTVLVVALFAAFAVLGVRAAIRAPDHFGTLLASGVTVWVVGQAVINVGAVIGILPVTGVPLPFVSFGGSSLVITMAAVGMLANVARQGCAAGGADAGLPADAPAPRRLGVVSSVFG